MIFLVLNKKIRTSDEMKFIYESPTIIKITPEHHGLRKLRGLDDVIA